MNTQATPENTARIDTKRARLMESIRNAAPSTLGLFRRVFARKSPPRDAIKAKCLECVWFDRKAITECSSPACPLWEFRPYQKDKAAK